MKKSILLSLLLTASLFSTEIELKDTPNAPKHKLPNSQNEIFSFNSILKESMNAVVNISTRTIVKTYNGQNRLYNDPFFQEFFGQRGQQKQAVPSQNKKNSL